MIKRPNILGIVSKTAYSKLSLFGTVVKRANDESVNKT